MYLFSFHPITDMQTSSRGPSLLMLFLFLLKPKYDVRKLCLVLNNASIDRSNSKAFFLLGILHPFHSIVKLIAFSIFRGLTWNWVKVRQCKTIAEQIKLDFYRCHSPKNQHADQRKLYSVIDKQRSSAQTKSVRKFCITEPTAIKWTNQTARKFGDVPVQNDLNEIC